MRSQQLALIQSARPFIRRKDDYAITAFLFIISSTASASTGMSLNSGRCLLSIAASDASVVSPEPPVEASVGMSRFRMIYRRQEGCRHRGGIAKQGEGIGVWGRRV